MLFTQLNLHPALLKGIKELGFVRPTPIQAEAIPPALEKRDLIACAQTGSGKTAAFLLPILTQIIDKPRRATRALVLAPTRELAAQILEDLSALAVHTPVTGAAVFGGVGMGPQEHAFRSGVDVIIATPGRLLDHLKSRYASFDKLEHLVLDEADRMLDMGFLPEIRKILKYLPAKRQTLFFSATMPPPIAALAKEMLRDPATISLQRQAAPASGITQAIYPVAQELKAPLLIHLLTQRTIAQALVFTRTKHRANRLTESLVQAGIQAERIHGNRSQSQRTAALAGFKEGRFPVLVATDIAARGIDVDELGHVVNFDVPAAPEDYIHRVGRTGRAEATGEAFTLVSPAEEEDLRNIEKAVGRRLPRVTLPDFDYTARPKAKLEVPLAQRIAEIRARKREERERAQLNAARRASGLRGSRPPRAGHGPAGSGASGNVAGGAGSRSGHGHAGHAGHAGRSGSGAGSAAGTGGGMGAPGGANRHPRPPRPEQSARPGRPSHHGPGQGRPGQSSRPDGNRPGSGPGGPRPGGPSGPGGPRRRRRRGGGGSGGGGNTPR